MTPRIIAVDWSGARVGAAKKIWLAEARSGVLLRLEGGRDREQIAEHLIDLQTTGDRLVAGLDFGFSFPQSFLRERGFASAPDAWRWLSEERCADTLLARCETPFWGAPGRRRHDGVTHFRRTEHAVESAEGVRPKSVFQISGAGSVGTGSIRGMCCLHTLRGAGFAVWPLDAAGDSTAIEIYPRLFARGVKKANRDARNAHLDTLAPPLTSALREIASSSDDAFDAAVSAIAMSRHAAALDSLPAIDEPQLRMEGIIWWPRWQKAHGL